MAMHSTKFYLTPLLFLALLCPQLLFADKGEGIYVISEDSPRHHIGKGVHYFEDPTLEQNLQQVQTLRNQGQFARSDLETLNMGYRTGALWLSFSLKSTLSQTKTSSLNQRLFLSIGYPLLDDIQLFQISKGQIKKLELGDYKPYQDRFYNVPKFVFPIEIPPGEAIEYYLRITSTSSISVPLIAETEASFINAQHKADISNGIYFGITIGLGIYNLFLWLGVRKQVYGWYALAILNLVAFNATISGFGYRFWPNAIEFQQIAIYILSVTAGAAVTAFGMVFLKTKKFQPRMHRGIVIFLGCYLLCLPVMFFIPTMYAAKLNAITLLTGVIILLVVSVRSFLLGYRPAIYYIVGQGAVLFSVMFTIFTSQGVLPLFHLAADVMKWSSAFELIFFSLGLADLVNHERRLRAKAEQSAIKVQKAMLQAEVSKNEQLDNLVRQRTEELESANQRLEELNTLDELTGLKNRRYLNQVLPAEHQRAFRERQSISILMFDLDHFKGLNDTYGHQFGDLCLSTAGEIICSNIRRPPDIGVRYGGEEFVVVLPNTDIDGAKLVAEKIRKLFESTTVSDDHHRVKMTVSIGIAGGIPTVRDHHEALLKQADDMLYEAKANGRNQIVCTPKQAEIDQPPEQTQQKNKPTN